MIGPSAPNGPPVPIAIAAESGLRISTRAGILLSPNSTFSITSGMPCPRIAADPYFAMNPTMMPPRIGISSNAAGARCPPPGETKAPLSLP